MSADEPKAEMIITLQSRLECVLSLDAEIAARVSEYLVRSGTVIYATLFDSCWPPLEPVDEFPVKEAMDE